MLAGVAGVRGVQAAEPANDELDTVLITAQRADRASSGATGLDLDIKDTPQSISFVSRDLMTDFGTNNLNDALRLATGISVEEWETNRTNYLARGFEIKNTQVDGVGLPNNWGIVTGAMDSYGYEKLEVIRGANGLLTGVGNASGTMNFVRKRPTNQAQGEIGVQAGSWDALRVQADYSTPLTDSGSWAARVVAVYDDSDSYLRSLHNERVFAYGVVDGQLGDRTTVTVGYALQNADTTGNMWGALVLANSDGTQAEFPRDSSTTQDWTFWNTEYRNAFLEVTYALGDNWSLRGNYNYRKTSENDALFYAYTYVGLDPVTQEGLYGYPYRGVDGDAANLGDVKLSGHLDAWGRRHQLMLGVSQSGSTADFHYHPVDFSDPAYGALPAFPYAGNVIPEPAWGDRVDSEHSGQKLRRVYGAGRLALTDRLNAVVGFNYADYSRQGIVDGVYFEQGQKHTSPYGGLTFDITPHLMAYGSYSDIFQPQDQKDINRVYLDPSKGENLEVGVKADWLEKRLLTSLAWFKARQLDLATFDGISPDDGIYYYKGMDVDSEGLELEASGRLNDYAELVFGFTALKLKDPNGVDTYDWVPRQTANLALTSRIPGLPQLRAGISGRWQSETSTLDGTTSQTIRQGDYLTLNLFGQWQASEKLGVRANVNNLTGEKHITSLYSVGYYSEPTNYAVTLNYRF